MATFLLVHGMFHGGWCWDRLKRRLEQGGHEVVAPDLAGCGSDATPAPEVTLDGWARDVGALAVAAADPVILVGHSRGGLVASEVAERHPEAVAQLVYLTALMLPAGSSAMHLPQIMQEEGFSTDVANPVPRMSADGSAMLPPENAVDLFYGSCSEEDRAWATPQIGQEPLAPLITPIAVTAERWGRIPRVYIETTEDGTLSIAAQRAMVARSGVDEVFSIASDHMPILTHVEELADILEKLAARTPRLPA
jgi:pimeloyl-ACP methyl ester carboxylesterase